jgi:hypothetical protein
MRGLLEWEGMEGLAFLWLVFSVLLSRERKENPSEGFFSDIDFSKRSAEVRIQPLPVVLADYIRSSTGWTRIQNRASLS